MPKFWGRTSGAARLAHSCLSAELSPLLSGS